MVQPRADRRSAPRNLGAVPSRPISVHALVFDGLCVANSKKRMLSSGTRPSTNEPHPRAGAVSGVVRSTDKDRGR